MTSDEELAWLREIVRDLQPLAGKQMDEIAQLRADLAASNARVAELEAATKPEEPPNALVDWVNEVLTEYSGLINSESEPLSILYDVDLLPEQVATVLRVNPRSAGPNASRMSAICELWKRIASANTRLARQSAMIEAMDAFAAAHEQWEADLILCNKAWTVTGLPKFTDELWNRAMELQAKRNVSRAAKAAMEGEA